MKNLTALEPYIDKTVLTQLESINPIVVSAVILLLAGVVAMLAVFLIRMFGKRITSRTNTKLDDKLLEATEQPVFRLIIIGGLYLAIATLGLSNQFVELTLKLLVTVAYIVIILFLTNVVDVVVNYGLLNLAKKTESTIDDEIIPIAHKTVSALVWVSGAMMILSACGVNIGPLLAGLGIAGLAVSFALQSTLANIFAGVSIILDKTFKVGDSVQLDNGETGTIHDITLRSTRLLTANNEIIIVPNDLLAKTKIKNYAQPDPKIRVVINFNVEYGNNPERIIKIIKEAIKNEIKDILNEPPIEVVFSEMAESSLKFNAMFWVADYSKAYDKKIKATNLIYNELKKAKIEIPFPTRTVYMKK